MKATFNSLIKKPKKKTAFTLVTGYVWFQTTLSGPPAEYVRCWFEDCHDVGTHQRHLSLLTFQIWSTPKMGTCFSTFPIFQKKKQLGF